MGSFYYLSGRNTEITVESKERVVKTSGESVDSYYLVFTHEGDVYKNDDNLFLWKFNSSDVQASLKVDSTYNVRIYGWRVPFFSMYPNIRGIN